MLTLTPPEISEITVNGMGLDEFLAVVVDDLVATLAAEQGLSEAEAQAIKVLVALQMPALIEDFETQIAGEGNVTSTFSIEGDTLTMTDEEGGSSEWSRVVIPSAVETITWGQLKTTAR